MDRGGNTSRLRKGNGPRRLGQRASPVKVLFRWEALRLKTKLGRRSILEGQEGSLGQAADSFKDKGLSCSAMDAGQDKG